VRADLLSFHYFFSTAEDLPNEVHNLLTLPNVLFAKQSIA
jgi:hypothetical protein